MKMVRLMAAPVRVYSSDQMHFFDAYAFLDGGSNIALRHKLDKKNSTCAVL